MNYQEFADYVTVPCCIIAVAKTEDGGYGDIRIIAANRQYRAMMGPGFQDGMIYSDLVPQDNKFEEFCYRAAVLGQRMHCYVEAIAYNGWMDQSMTPLKSEEDNVGYCQFVIEMTEKAEAERMVSVSAETASVVLKACIAMMGSEDFRESIGEVLEDIMAYSGASAARIMLVDHEKKQAILYSERMDEKVWGQRRPSDTNDVITYELMETWDKMIGISSSAIVKDAEEMEKLRTINPLWAEDMIRDGVVSVILIPLRREKNTLGYLYIVNYNVEKTVAVKELTELLAYFISSEIFNNLLLKKLEELSNIDVMTGLNNRRSMIRRMGQLAECACRPSFGVINIDLNGLKYVNDNDGHDAGDSLLIQAGELLRKVFYEDDLYRTGGDEFIVITSGIDRETFERKIERLRNDIKKNSALSFAIGGCWSDGSDDMTTVFRNADERMYEDKETFYRNHPELKR